MIILSASKSLDHMDIAETPMVPEFGQRYQRLVEITASFFLLAYLHIIPTCLQNGKKNYRLSNFGMV